MNAYLKTIQELLQQATHLSEQEKQALLTAVTTADKQWSITDFKLERTEQVKKTITILLEETIEELEQKRKAVEAQNRELEIEAALERVRAIALSMKEPADMLNVCRIISQQLELLNVKEIRNVQTAIFNRQKGIYLNYEFFRLHDKTTITEVEYNLQPDVKGFVSQMLTDPEAFFTTAFEGARLKDWMEYQEKANQFVDPHLYEVNSLHYYFYSIGPGALGVSTYSPLSEEGINLLKRFRNVFELAYRRFIDIEQAEAQARKAQIEAALERVRSRTMAMHKTDELLDAAALVYKELSALGLTSMAINYAFVDEEEKYGSYYSINLDGTIPPFPFIIPHTETEVMRSILSSWKRQEPFNVIELGEEDTLNHQTYIGEHLLNSIIRNKIDMPFSVESFLAVSPKTAVIYSFNFTQGYLFIIGEERLTAMQEEMVLRFAKVFGLTYRRFLDLKQAEAQAREAKIEAALERVRARAMAMHKSEDLNEAVATVFEEFEKLNFGMLRCGIGIINKERRSANAWITSIAEQGTTVQIWGEESMDLHPLLQGVFDAWLQHKDFSYVLKGDDMRQYYQTSGIGNVRLPDSQLILSGDELSEQHYHIATFEAGGLFAFRETAFPEEAKTVMKRFANVFNLTYKRFLDLQKAETQAREAQIEAALERVRAKVMAMNSSNELNETSFVFGEQLRKLGINWQFSYFWLIEEEKDSNTFWITWPDSQTSETSYSLAEADESFQECIIAWRRRDKIHSSYIPPQDVAAWLYKFERITNDAGGAALEIMKPGNFKEGVFYYDAMIKFGSFGICTNRAVAEEEKNILSRFAVEFERAYTRFLDMQQAERLAEQAKLDLINLKEEKNRTENVLSELRAAQSQLIQAEKMASLGELTAGIAHEIQNPLNFVSNFSEVCNELLEEMKTEWATGNGQQAIALADDIKHNLEKILFHGRRADAIVKGMLQHSRKSSGVKEPTDINALADEYLRLSYHGLRAKDKSFNATIQTDLDGSIEKIQVVPQDIGRVLLNLYNNAFYAVMEKKKQGQDGYEPVVSVSTRKLNGKVEIRVRDNGMGIPQKVLDKIFQPFFTTKPTGEGTGLGLSLSYEIITKEHGGELKAETREGEFAEFIIRLPVQ